MPKQGPSRLRPGAAPSVHTAASSGPPPSSTGEGVGGKHDVSWIRQRFCSMKTSTVDPVQAQPKMVSVGSQRTLPSPVHSDDESPFDFTDEPGDVSWIPQEEMRSDLSDEEPLQELLPDLHMWVSVFLEEPANAAWKYAACNLLLSGATHFSGCMAAQTIRMLQLFGLQSISVGTFFRHQRLDTIPSIVQNEPAGVIRDLSEAHPVC
ncbi:hypothetical protein Q8A67_005467 [Cirrhinus molitorella]|uniref:Uncharacterized protein n=1 Tax=Cirrhinus molitorella TaxID=172907 RepID=A0AA88Q3F3_9TELE|nr:hypothetical protein Q8A67_005467 [Cirrhinus molitorella]